MRKVSALVEIEVERPRLFASGCKSLLCGPTYLLIFTLLFVAVVVQSPSHVPLCDPMDSRTPGLPVPHHLPKFAQVHVHCISDAIQPSHPLRPSSPSALNVSQHQGLSSELLFSSDDQHTGASALTSVLPVQGWFPLRLTGLISLPSKGLLGFFSSTTVWRHQFLVFCLLYGPVLTTVHDH